MKGDSLRPAAAWALGLALFLAMHSCKAHAQDDAFARVVVQVTAHEAGLDSLADADGIHATLVHGAERHGMTPVAFAHAYSPRLFRGTTARPWVLGLRLDCRRPSGYPLPWTALGARTVSRRDACLALAAHARELVAGAPRCDAEDWSAQWLPLAPRLERVDCGDTLNLFARRVR